MQQMTDALTRISKYCNIRRPNRSREEVEQQLSFFQFELAEEVYEYYQWAGAPIGDKMPEGWDGSHNDNSTYYCGLESFLGYASDLIHFLSLEEAKNMYPNYPGNPDTHELRFLPFMSYENGMLVIAGAESPTEASIVMQNEARYELWFPSLTDMMLAIAETIETIGTLMPGSTVDEHGNSPEPDEEQRQWKIWRDTAKKYGSPRGAIITN
jgi:hypothetical protein